MNLILALGVATRNIIIFLGTILLEPSLDETTSNKELISHIRDELFISCITRVSRWYYTRNITLEQHKFVAQKHDQCRMTRKAYQSSRTVDKMHNSKRVLSLFRRKNTLLWIYKVTLNIYKICISKFIYKCYKDLSKPTLESSTKFLWAIRLMTPQL